MEWLEKCSHLVAVGLVILVLELQLGHRRGDGGDVPVRSIFQNDAIHLRYEKRKSLNKKQKSPRRNISIGREI